VRDRADTPTTRQALDALAGVEEGVVLVRPVPGCGNTSELALSVLAALGKHVTAARISRVKALTISWIAGHQPHNIVIDRAHTLHPRVSPSCWS
jgi:hypothetical protein